MLFSFIARLKKKNPREKNKNSEKEILLVFDPSKTDIIPMLKPFHTYLLKFVGVISGCKLPDCK